MKYNKISNLENFSGARLLMGGRGRDFTP